jgi:hypothetical protein
MSEIIDKVPSAYDFVIKGKEVPPNVHKATIERAAISMLKTPYEQYLYCIKHNIFFNWPEDEAPAGRPPTSMEGGVPKRKEH